MSGDRAARSCALFVGVWLSGCGMGPPPGVRQQAVIADQAHSGGQAGFFFLSPIVQHPAPVGPFDGTQSPVVEIDEIDPATASVLGVVATYDMTSGPRSERVRIDRCEPSYVLKWHTRKLALNSALDYRIQVSLAGRTVGFADVDVVDSPRQVRGVDRQNYVPLVNGRTLPIRWFMNPCAGVVCHPSDACHDAGICDPSTGQCSNPVKPGACPASPLHTGDVVVALCDSSRSGAESGVVQITPSTGAQSLLTSKGNLACATGIAIEPSGQLLVTDRFANSVVRVDPASGAQTVLTSSGLLNDPRGLAVSQAGDVYAASLAGGGVVRIDPVSGTQTLVASIAHPLDVDIDAAGDLIVLDSVGSTDAAPTNVWRIDPATGAATLVSSNGAFDSALGLAVEASGAILVADAQAPRPPASAPCSASIRRAVRKPRCRRARPFSTRTRSPSGPTAASTSPTTTATNPGSTRSCASTR